MPAMLLKPRRLEFGDTLGIVAPASPPPDPNTIDRAVGALEILVFKAKLAPNVRRRLGFLAGTDRERAGDLMRMFADRKVRGILCVRGGYGAGRLLGLLDYHAIRDNPKVFVGYSDITALHCALLAQARLVSFHGPMLNSDFLREPVSDFTVRSFLRTVMEPCAPGSICQEAVRSRPSVLRGGTVSGPLVGGNLSLLCSTLGTPFQPPFRNRILFLEDLGEAPYRFDRMLTQLLNAGLLQQVAGVAVGQNRNCRDPKARPVGEYRQTLEDVLRDCLLPLKVPVVIGLPFGHVRHIATLPVGVEARLDGNRGDLSITDPAVS
jgi:muramoyltetrapeptide carboxypeptidase